MPKRAKAAVPTRLVQEWPLTPAATLGSSVRSRGILLEIRSRLPKDLKKLVDVETGAIVLRVSEDNERHAHQISAIVSKALEGIEEMPVIPREIEDILAITSGERHRWLKDGRLKSAGTRTVKLRGRARKITFHVFDPRYVEDVLDSDLPSLWREDDAIAAAENRKRAAGKAAMKRAETRRRAALDDGARYDEDQANPDGLDDFLLDGLLR